VSALYGNDLKNKLRRDVLTISQQTLTSAQKEQVLSNIGAASQEEVDALNSKITRQIETGNDTVKAIRSGNTVTVVCNGTSCSGAGILSTCSTLNLPLPIADTFNAAFVPNYGLIVLIIRTNGNLDLMAPDLMSQAGGAGVIVFGSITYGC
jgi:hypothetical protein